MSKPKLKKAMVKKAGQSQPAPRPAAQAGGPNLDNTIWIVERLIHPEGKRYWVYQSPKLVRKDQAVYFFNLTGHKAEVIAPAVFAPGKFEVPSGLPPTQVKAVGAYAIHRYQVSVNGDPAHGSSDPDIIIVP